MNKENEQANASPEVEEDMRVKEKRAKVDYLKECLAKLEEAFIPFRESANFYSCEVTLQGTFDDAIVKSAAELGFEVGLVGSTGFVRLEKDGIRITLT